MSYNLLLNTEFKTHNNWHFINCKYNDGRIISSDKIFGIEQELVLPDPTKLYFRTSYKTLTTGIYDVMIGIQNNNTLSVDRRIPKYMKQQNISVVDNAKQEKIKVQIIFKSLDTINEVIIKEPILVDLIALKRSKWLKLILDRTINYCAGYSYENIYNINEIKLDANDFKELNLLPAKIGSIFKSKESKKIPITAKFINKGYYLVKLDLKEINQLGNIYFQYGVIKSVKDNEQIYITFKYRDDIPLYLIIEPNDVLEYKVNLKHILIIDTTEIGLLREDIISLPYIEE